MVLSLLRLDKNERIGMKEGLEEFKRHPWLEGIDWKAH